MKAIIRFGAALFLVLTLSCSPVFGKPRFSPQQLAVLTDNAFAAIWIDMDLEEADIETEVRAALDAGVSPNARDRFGEDTLLLQAIENQRPKIVRLLLRRGANPNLAVLKNKTGYEVGETPLLRIVKMDDSFFTREQGTQSQRIKIMRLLLQRGAQVNGRDGNGDTALIIAARDGHADATALLLNYHADFRLRDANGQTALRLAAMKVGRGSIFIPGGIYESEGETEKLARQDEKRLATGRAAVVRLLRATGAKE